MSTSLAETAARIAAGASMEPGSAGAAVLITSTIRRRPLIRLPPIRRLLISRRLPPPLPPNRAPPRFARIAGNAWGPTKPLNRRCAAARKTDATDRIIISLYRLTARRANPTGSRSGAVPRSAAPATTGHSAAGQLAGRARARTPPTSHRRPPSLRRARQQVQSSIARLAPYLTMAAGAVRTTSTFRMASVT
jgi:hypothetical protein